MRTLFPLLLLFATASPLIAQDTDAVAKKATQEVTLELAFRSPNPPIARLSLKPIETGEHGGLKTVAYSVNVNDLPRNKSYILMSWDIGTDAPIVALHEIRIDDKGQLRCGTAESCPGSAAGAELRLRVTGMLGQPRRFVLTGKDKKPLAMGEAVPFPAMGNDNQCSLEAVILRPDASVTLLIGQGFVPGEEVKRISSSRGETVDGRSKADDTGRALALVLPFVKGYNDGQTSYTYQGSKCHPTTTFNWGSYREVQSETPPSP